ncbi:hypothetical protein C8R44DRAFT_894111 [Mycena epipterygia]|nr:hypothetical protein C8R44DRAFT_894111 [Mycena epipterygia]
MQSPTQLDNVIEYTKLAASTAKEISDVAQIPFLSSTASLSLAILGCVESVRSNREAWTSTVLLRAHAGSRLDRMNRVAEDRHKELLELLSASLALTNSEYASSVTGTLSSSAESTGSLSMIPAPPQIFHGRDSELHDVVNMLAGDCVRIAILGTGGMGKTSLALAALHQTDITTKYSHRYFVSCHSAGNCSELSSIVASHIGLEMGSQTTRRIVHHFMTNPPALLILDNFETPWEPSGTRSEVEDFLSLLTDMPHLAIVVSAKLEIVSLELKSSR